MIRNAGLHRRSHAERLVDASEIVVHVMERHGGLVVVELLAEGGSVVADAAVSYERKGVAT